MADEEQITTVEQKKDEPIEDQPQEKDEGIEDDQEVEKTEGDQEVEKTEGDQEVEKTEGDQEVEKTEGDQEVEKVEGDQEVEKVEGGQEVMKAEGVQEAEKVEGGQEAVKVEGDASPAPGKDDDRKVFIGGLSWSTKEATLREYFSKYGDITSINIKTDQHTGKSRGFAFVVFKEPASVEKVVAVSHTIDSRKVEPSKAKKRHGKIFVGGLKTEISDDDIKTHFTKFGTITEVIIPKDKSKNIRKNFCFVEFEEEQVAKNLVKEGKATINDIQVEIKRVTPKSDGMEGGGRGGRGGRGGGGRGGFGGGFGMGYAGYAGYGYGDYGYSGYGYGGGYGDYGYGGGYGGARGGRGFRHSPY